MHMITRPDISVYLKYKIIVDDITFNDTYQTITIKHRFPEIDDVYANAAKYAEEHKLEYIKPGNPDLLHFKPLREPKPKNKKSDRFIDTEPNVHQNCHVSVTLMEDYDRQILKSDCNTFDDLKNFQCWSNDFTVNFYLIPSYFIKNNTIRVIFSCHKIDFEQVKSTTKNILCLSVTPSNK